MSEQPFLPIFEDVWLHTVDGDDTVRSVFNRHYSRVGNKKLFVGPGIKVVLLTPDAKAVFVWRKFISDNGQNGVNCAVFRNEGLTLSSELVKEADKIADRLWPGERHYTYVNPRKIKSANPGYCFLMAGWQRCGQTKVRQLVILERVVQP